MKGSLHPTARTSSNSWCAFVGDRGFLHPEPTHSATAEEVIELEGRDFDQYLSSNRTCEVGNESSNGKGYHLVIFLLEKLTRSES
jgi:D-lactate dehydrogenase